MIHMHVAQGDRERHLSFGNEYATSLRRLGFEELAHVPFHNMSEMLKIVPDFLKLESFTELFTVAEDVPAGDYNKIRLTLDRLRLVDLDDMGNVIEAKGKSQAIEVLPLLGWKM